MPTWSEPQKESTKIFSMFFTFAALCQEASRPRKLFLGLWEESSCQQVRTASFFQGFQLFFSDGDGGQMHKQVSESASPLSTLCVSEVGSI